MRGFKIALLLREQGQMVAMARRWLEVEGALDAQISALAREMLEAKEAGRAVSQAALLRMKRYQALMVQLKGEMAAYTGYAEGVISAGQEELIRLGIGHGAEAIGAVVTEAGGFGVFFDVLPVDALELMVGLAGDGSPLQVVLEGAFGEAAEGVTKALLEGTALGWNPRKTASAMKDGLTQGLDKCLNVARTEQMRVYREASRRQYEHSTVVEGFRRLATHDDGVCAACLMAEGERYKVETALRDHPGGRCTMVPIVRGMPEVRWQLGQDWFREQDESRQRKILGPGRFEGWKAGTFGLGDLVTVTEDKVWGDGVAVTPLKQLVS